MVSIQNYVKAESLEQAYELNQKKSAVILGGMMWIRLGKRSIHTAIDLSGLALDSIEETEQEFLIGCMCSLHKIETNERLKEYFGDTINQCLSPIVGVQFRNMATIGGTVYGRFGFSDIITLLLALEASVELYQKGMIKLKDFIKKEQDKDILVRIHIPKEKRKIVYSAQRNTAADLPVLTAAVSKKEENWIFSVGARPKLADIYCLSCPKEEMKNNLDSIILQITHQFEFGSNTRGSREYRKHLCEVYLRRAAEQIIQQEEVK